MKTEILVIEDNEQNLYLTTYILKNKGHQVLQARNGRDGIELAMRHIPALIILDIQLPIMDGYEVARTLRSHPELSSTPIVAVTSYAMVGDRKRIINSGCSGYIEKPINPDTFIREIEQYLSPQTAELQRGTNHENSSCG